MNSNQLFTVLKNTSEDKLDETLDELKSFLEVRDGSGDTPLLLAVRSLSFESIALKLIEKDVNLEAKTMFGSTPLIVACRNTLTKVALKLIEKNVDLNVQTVNKNSALIWAACQRLEDVAFKLVEKNADPYLKDNSDQTAIDYIKSRWEPDARKKILDLIELKNKPAVSVVQTTETAKPEATVVPVVQTTETAKPEAKPEAKPAKYPFNLVLVDYLNNNNVTYKVESGFIIPL